ncbi:MAG: MFS transporter [Blastocatellia bacterium]|nr:MFS transporter [Blastocatellia bacterium]
MLDSRSPLVIIFITIFIDLIGFGIVIPVLPLYAERFGASEAVIGILIAVYSAMQFIFAPILGKLSDRVGRRPVLLVSLIGSSMGFLLMGFADALWLLFVARAIDGITGGNISTAQAYIADVTPPDQRSRGMGLIGAAFGLGFIFGPAIGGAMSLISPAAPFFFAAALAAVNATALYFRLPESLSAEHRSQARERPSVVQILKATENRTLMPVMAAYFFATVAFGLLTSTYALFANHRFNFDATHTGYMFAYLGVLGAVIQGGLLGRLVKTFGDKSLAVSGTALLAASMFALPVSATLTMLIITSTGIAIGNSLMTPTLNGLASNSVDAANQGRVLGAMSAVASLARIIGPATGGWLLSRDAGNISHYGRSPYWTGGAIMIIALGLALVLQPRSASEKPATVEGQGTQDVRG